VQAIKLDAKASRAVTLLNEDALAKAWSLYQICVLKEAGEELRRVARS